MQSFVRLSGRVAVLERPNVDTDQIIPGRFLRKPRDHGYGSFLFHDLGVRLDPDAQILISGPNFGCGSSREGAVWALVDRGFRVVIAPSFGDIFFNNACRNGLLPVQLEAQACASLAGHPVLSVDLPDQTVFAPGGPHHRFEIDPFRKNNLLQGLDDVTLTLGHEAAIERFERYRDQG